MTERRLHLDGVGAPIVTQVTRQSATGITVEQTLPFLRLHTLVHDDDSVPSTIESVSMVVYDGLPRLVLDLAYETGPGRGAVRDRAPAAHGGIIRPQAREETRPFGPVEEPRDPTATFQTHVASQFEPSHNPGAEMTLEEQLLRSNTISYKLEQAWLHVQPALRVALAYTRRFAVWSCDIGIPVMLNWLGRARDGTLRLARGLETRLRKKAT